MYVVFPILNASFQDLRPCFNCTQVQWDEPSAVVRPDRVSPWELEPLDATNTQPPQPPLRSKRARPPASPSIAPELPPAFGMWLLSCCAKL